MGHDITKRKAATGQSRDTAARAQSLLDTVVDGIITIDERGIVETLNPVAERMFGYAVAEVVGRNIKMLMPEPFHSEHDGYIERYRATGEARIIGIGREVMARRKNGDTFPVELAVSEMLLGGKRYFTGIVRDVSSRKHAEDALRRAYEELDLERSKLAAAFDNTDMGLVLSDPQGGDMIMNAAALRFHGFASVTDMHGRVEEYPNEWELRYLDGRIMPYDEWPLVRAMRGDFVRDYEAHLRNRISGYEWSCSYTGKPVRNSAGELSLIVLTLLDVTKRERAEKEIGALNTELERRVHERTAQLDEANKELDSFSYSVSHDLRAPLRHVQGYVDMLQRATEGQLSSEARRFLETIRAASVDMGQLIDDLLAFSRMSRMELHENRVPLDGLVHNSVRGLEMATKGRSIVWKIAPLPQVVADPAMLKQVLVNLIGNAIKYSRQRDPAEIEIGCAGEENGRCILFVRDNGAGFDMQYAHKLFGVFQRLHHADEFEGTGIGLATVRRVIARHGGRVWAEGVLGQGATFYFTLQPATAA